MAAKAHLRLLSRPGCHLCEEMASTLQDMGITFECVNIEDDPALEHAYGSAIPVLMRGDVELARAPQSARTLKRVLQRAGVT